MNATTPRLRFEQEAHWEVIHATKAQLQRFGIGTGLGFPGEGRTPRKIWTVDPRGYETRIERSDDGYFNALVYYPGLTSNGPNFPSPPIAGLKPSTSNGPYFDQYIGGAAEIVAAGLARMDQLPGQSGTAKVQVCILRDGSIATSARDARRNDGGARSITKLGKSSFRVYVRTDDVERKRRENLQHAAYVLHQRNRARLPRPAILLAVHRELKRLAAVEQEAQAPANLHNGFWLRTAEGA